MFAVASFLVSPDDAEMRIVTHQDFQLVCSGWYDNQVGDIDSKRQTRAHMPASMLPIHRNISGIAHGIEFQKNTAPGEGCRDIEFPAIDRLMRIGKTRQAFPKSGNGDPALRSASRLKAPCAVERNRLICDRNANLRLRHSPNRQSD